VIWASCFLGRWRDGFRSDGLGEVEADVCGPGHHAFVDARVVAVIELEAESGNNVSLLDFRDRVPEELCLGKVLGEFYAMQALFHHNKFLWVVGPIVDLSFGDFVTELSVPVVAHHRTNWSIDWEFLPVYAETGELRIKIGEIATLQKRIVREADSWDSSEQGTDLGNWQHYLVQREQYKT